MLGIRFWSLSALYTLAAALFIGVPTVLIPNPFFVRVVPTSPLDYTIWAISILLIGPLLALATLYPMSAQGSSRLAGKGTGRAFGGWILSFLSVGCPVCNKVVVLLLGFSGAMTFFAPLQPLLGIASISMLGVTLFLRIRVLRYGCPVPLGKSAALPQKNLP